MRSIKKYLGLIVMWNNRNGTLIIFSIRLGMLGCRRFGLTLSTRWLHVITPLFFSEIVFKNLRASYIEAR